MNNSVQYITDTNGSVNAVILPIALWKQINCKDETEYLLSSKKNKSRLLEALYREESISKEEAYGRFEL
ncbi:MAG: hypothetical protein HW421_3827 [Ignavibacteria bacterium]|nr:hypothetical protein [Ignavibacteria bacterium]